MKSKELNDLTERAGLMQMCAVFAKATALYSETYYILITEGIDEIKARKSAAQFSDAFIRKECQCDL